MGMAFFIDLTLCTACRGCQIACKQWKKLPAEKTKNTGSHTNPPDLSYITYKTVHFIEKGLHYHLRLPNHNIKPGHHFYKMFNEWRTNTN